MRFIIHLCSVLIIAAAFARAEEPKQPTRSLRFYYVSFAQAGDATDPQASFLIRNGKQTVSLALQPNAFSSILNYEGTPPVSLFREVRTDHGVQREDLGQLTFPAEWRGALFIVTRDTTNPTLPFRFYPIEYWAPSLPDEHLRLMNLCPYPLAAKVGGNQAAVAARAVADLGLPADRPDIPLGLAVQHAERWERILSTAIMRPEQNKLMMLVFPGPSGMTRSLVLTDLPEPPSETAAGAPIGK
jgi:hypothetical protein